MTGRSRCRRDNSALYWLQSEAPFMKQIKVQCGGRFKERKKKEFRICTANFSILDHVE